MEIVEYKERKDRTHYALIATAVGLMLGAAAVAYSCHNKNLSNDADNTKPVPTPGLEEVISNN